MWASSVSYLCAWSSYYKLLFHRGAIQALKSLDWLENKSVGIHIDQFHTLIKEYANELISCFVEWFPFVASIALFWKDAILSFSCNTISEWFITAQVESRFRCSLFQLCKQELCNLHNYTITFSEGTKSVNVWCHVSYCLYVSKIKCSYQCLKGI